MQRSNRPFHPQFASLVRARRSGRDVILGHMSVVELLDLDTFDPSEPVPVDPSPSFREDDDDDGWDAETADETPEDLEAMILAARDELADL